MTARRALGGRWAAALLITAARLAAVSTARAEPPHAARSVSEVSEPDTAEGREPHVAATPLERQRTAEQLRARAQQLFDQEQYSAAAAQFERAFLLTGAARDRFNQGTSLHWEGNCDGARMAFQQYLALEDIESVEREERRAEATTALVHLRRQCPQPNPALASAPHVRRAGVVPAPATEAMRGEAATGPSEVWMWTAFGTGAALGLASIVTAVAANGTRSELEDLGRVAAASGSTWEDCCAERARELNAEQQRLQTATAVLGVSSVVLLGAGAVLWSLDLDAGASEPTGTRIHSVRLAYRAPF